MTSKPESKESLWWLAVSPTLWALHFLASYITVAVWCAKVGSRESSLGPARTAVIVYTAIALLGVGVMAVRSYRRHAFGSATVPHDFDTPEDRHRFLGFAALLLSLLSAAGIVYVAIPLLFIETCR